MHEDDGRCAALSGPIVGEDTPCAGPDLAQFESAGPEERVPRGEQRGERDDQGFTKRSAKRSLVPRRSPAAGGEEFQSRASCGLRRKSPSACSLNPALSTSSLTNCSSMRCKVLASFAPVPGLALESMRMYSPPGLRAAKTARFILS